MAGGCPTTDAGALPRRLRWSGSSALALHRLQRAETGGPLPAAGDLPQSPQSPGVHGGRLALGRLQDGQARPPRPHAARGRHPLPAGRRHTSRWKPVAGEAKRRRDPGGFSLPRRGVETQERGIWRSKLATSCSQQEQHRCQVWGDRKCQNSCWLSQRGAVCIHHISLLHFILHL